MKIWYQSFTDPEQHAAYFERLREHLEHLASPGVELRVEGMSPSAAELHSLTEFRCARLAVRNAIRAERENYDAFLLGHFQDAGLDVARSSVRIPVLGLGKTSLFFARLQDRTIGLVTINPVFISWHEQQISAYDLQDQVVGITAIDSDVDDFVEGFGSESAGRRIRDSVTHQAEPLIERGAEIIIPAGGLPMLLLAGGGPFDIEGTPVLNGIAVLLNLGETFVNLRQLENVPSGGSGSLPSDEALNQFLASFGDQPDGST